MLNLSHNLGRITGASLMGALFVLASTASNITTAHHETVASGMRVTFAVAATLIIAAMVIAIGSRVRSTPSSSPEDAS